MTAPEDFAQWCRVQADIEHSLRLLQAFQAECQASQITLASQLTFLAYYLAELDQQAPEKGVIGPAFQILVERHIAVLNLADAPPRGRA